MDIADEPSGAGAERADLLADGVSAERSVFIGSLRAASQISLHFIRRELIGASNEARLQGPVTRAGPTGPGPPTGALSPRRQRR
ncbi:hypothetical protein EYF80_056343 [Liparis tanakae]|uniref:Uncharacterized protein n=1 Tax=Liparis tanakae TaxID=230148 RepID=A0A4Z2EXD5_9TELE|nr:hypothetical protein EYF80_056343 [Liparis tanakae]